MIPDATHPVWLDIIQGRHKHDFGFLAVRILLGRLSIQAQSSNSPESLQACAEELRNLFVQSQRLPAARADLKKIFGEEALS